MFKRFLFLCAVALVLFCLSACSNEDTPTDITKEAEDSENTLIIFEDSFSIEPYDKTSNVSNDNNTDDYDNIVAYERPDNIIVKTDLLLTIDRNFSGTFEKYSKVSYPDGTDFYIHNDDIILLMLDGKYLSCGNVIQIEDIYYVPYTVLKQMGAVQLYTKQGFSTSYFDYKNGSISLYIYNNDMFIIYNGQEYIKHNVSIVYNDMKYIQIAAITDIFYYSITYIPELPSKNQIGTLVISDNMREALYTEEEARINLTAIVKKEYEIILDEIDYYAKYNLYVYTEDSIECIKNDINTFELLYHMDYGDYYIFKLNLNNNVYIFYNKYSGDIYSNVFGTEAYVYYQGGLSFLNWIYW